MHHYVLHYIKIFLNCQLFFLYGSKKMCRVISPKRFFCIDTRSLLYYNISWKESRQTEENETLAQAQNEAKHYENEKGFDYEL